MDPVSPMGPTLSRQYVLFDRLSRIVENLKKTGKANITATAIDARFSILETNWTKFQANDEVLSGASAAERQHDYFTSDLFSMAEEVYCEQRRRLSDMRNELEPAKAPVTPPASSCSLTHSHRSRSSLPRIELPTFSGHYSEWTRFRDLFSSLVINDNTWSEAERFHYLSASLSGDAADLIKQIPISSGNFHDAWTLLEHRFQNRRLLIDAQLDIFHSLRPSTTQSAQQLKALFNTSNNVIAALKSLDVKISDESVLFIYHIVSRLDLVTSGKWEKSLGNSTEPPTLGSLLEFLETTVRILESQEIRQSVRAPRPLPLTLPKVKSHHVAPNPSSHLRCNLCQGNHLLCFCNSFRSMDVPARLQLVSDRRWCLNCFGAHSVNDCMSSKRCQLCAQAHHSMLHDALASPSHTTTPASSLHSSQGGDHAPTSMLLATALVNATSPNHTVAVRALIDPCSEVSLISESLLNRLRLHRTPCSKRVFGAGARATATTQGKVDLTVTSTIPNRIASCALEALVLPRLTAYQPPISDSFDAWPHLQGLILADPRGSSKVPIDLLLGADVYPQLILDGTRRGGPLDPVAHETIFGWILTGPTSHPFSRSTVTSHHGITDDLSNMVTRFWEQEETNITNPQWTLDDEECDRHFKTTHRRQEDGRFVVRLFFNKSPSLLGGSHNVARRIFLATERRLQSKPTLYDAYRSFMQEYLTLGHMQLVPRSEEVILRPHFYLPHHGVFKGSESSAKLRVVFNGSCSSSSGKSLNSILSTGPKLQTELFDVLLRWRRHKVAFLADVEKMYRQIQIHPEDRDYQRVLWRNTPSDRIQTYRLTTVTYGLSCAPFLALRSLRQLAEDEAPRFPLGASVLRTSTYVDDILSGAESENDACTLQQELIDICTAGGFTLKKWNANRPKLLAHLPEDHLATSSVIAWYPEYGCSALGLTWHPRTDTLSLSFHDPSCPTTRPLTKRHILSQVAKLFDPLGWLAPFIVGCKILLQQLWQHNLEWDEPLPTALINTWTSLTSDVDILANLHVPRWLGTCSAISNAQVHVFVDASERAYAAVAYLRTVSRQRVRTVILAAKTKTAPLKTVSLPRLELCSAVLGAKLLARLERELDLHLDEKHMWSDSTITLAWLRGEPSRWQTFVANRVAEYQRVAPNVQLHHVRTQDNPADCASRGIPANQLPNHSLWWSGPDWLRSSSSSWESDSVRFTTSDEERPRCSHLVNKTDEPEVNPLLQRFSSMQALLRITAWCRRWKYPPTEAPSPHLHPSEISASEEVWIKIIQKEDFHVEINLLKQEKTLPTTSKLLRLTPILDSRGVLRIGGRLRHSLLSYDEQQPIILPFESHFTRLVVSQHHLRSLHGGSQMTLASIRCRFWILQGRRKVKEFIHHCIPCIRWRAEHSQQLMGQLPPHRVTPARPFTHSGVDYAGPFKLKITNGRGHKSTKGYVAVFICFGTRAVHLEAVSDYTTPAFIAAYRRFTSRRGLCSSLTSDCGTNFVGADQELRRLFSASSKESASISHQLATDGVEWRFNPPGAPHFGGLWEAAVRSFKHHLRRVISDTPLTFEELATFLCQVEACLNSRPLQPLTDDPEDLTPLTPGHFLVGGPLQMVPSPSLLNHLPNRLTRWQLRQQQVEHFWKRWSSEYLHTLQSRPKWASVQTPMMVGDMVLIRSEVMPPSKWPIARIIDTHPGDDGHVRVVTLKTASGTLVRPIVKLIRLHIQS